MTHPPPALDSARAAACSPSGEPPTGWAVIDRVGQRPPLEERRSCGDDRSPLVVEPLTVTTQHAIDPPSRRSGARPAPARPAAGRLPERPHPAAPTPS